MAFVLKALLSHSVLPYFNWLIVVVLIVVIQLCMLPSVSMMLFYVYK